jgi:hypothetical protein
MGSTSSYDARSFIELLQNADDAGASRFSVRRSGTFLLVANDGRAFDKRDFESLCRSAASSKVRGPSIGYRGIGFKSVVGFAQTVHLFSTTVEATFSRELTAASVPKASRVPLVRIPHPVNVDLRRELANQIAGLFDDGFRTVFVFADLIASGIESEFSGFDSTSLLFLRKIRQVELNAGVETMISIRREAVDSQCSSVRLASFEGTTNWTLVHKGDIALAMVCDAQGIARLEEAKAVVHAFLPTLEPTGFAFKVNGDLSTDPSRTRIILDERTAKAIEAIATLILDLVEQALVQAAPSDARLLQALIPVLDPRLVEFQRRGFRTELLGAIKRRAGQQFKRYLCRPQWLNGQDYANLAGASGVNAVDRNLENVEGLSSFLKFLGAGEAKVADLAPGLGSVAPSLAGAAEITNHLMSLCATRQMEPSQVDPEWKLWPIDDQPVSLYEAQQRRLPLDQSFIDLISEKCGGTTEFPRMLQRLTDLDSAQVLLPETTDSSTLADEGVSALSVGGEQKLSLKRWRGAEEQVLSLLQAWNWQVEDVTRQNLGYDIEGKDDRGAQRLLR